MINLNSKTAIFLLSSFLLGSVLILINASNKISQLRQEITQLQLQLKQCQDTNHQLINQIQIEQAEYHKAQQKLKEAYSKPAKRVYIKQVVKEPVYITNEDCQKMADLIRQAEEQLK